MKFLQVSGHSRALRALSKNPISFLRAFGSNHTSASYSTASPEEYGKRNYANNVSEYNTVVGSLNGQRRHFLLRDVYDDMLLDGVQPTRDTFHSLIVGTMKGARLQDAFFFRDEMKAMGLLPDVALYNFLISTCGKCKNSDTAIQLLEEMKQSGVKPSGQTYICLLNACAATGHLDRVYAIVRDMTAAGLGLNKFCYAGLIAAHRNKTPTTNETTKIIELVKQSKGWSSVEESTNIAENLMMGVSEEELYNMPTADYVHRRAFVFRELTVYHVALQACADLRSVETLEALLEMLKQDGYSPDIFIVIQTMRCYLYSGDIDRGVKTFDDYCSSGKLHAAELYVALIEGAMVGHTPRGMQIALETLEKMNSRGFFLNAKLGSELLLAAAGEKTGGYAAANYIWDLMQSRRLVPSLPAVEAYHRGLKEREIPADDPRLLLVTRALDNWRLRTGGARPPFNRS